MIWRGSPGSFTRRRDGIVIIISRIDGGSVAIVVEMRVSWVSSGEIDPMVFVNLLQLRSLTLNN